MSVTFHKSFEGAMKVKVIRATAVNGKPVAVGDVPEVSKADAHYLISIGKVVPYVEPEPEPVKKGKK